MCEWKGDGWERKVSHAIRACMLLHNLMIDHKEQTEFPDEKKLKEIGRFKKPEWKGPETLGSLRTAAHAYATTHFVLDQSGKLKQRFYQ